MQKEATIKKQGIAVYDLQDIVDGFLLGDGSIEPGKGTARLRCHVKCADFCLYMMSFFPKYNPTVSQNRDGSWLGSTKTHLDIYVHYVRWIKGSGTKKHRLPEDISVSKITLLLWYLGDGRLRNCAHEGYVSCPSVDLCTDCFNREDLDKILVPKLEDLGISCCVGNRNRICIREKSIGRFFSYIGECPVQSLAHRFNISTHRKLSVRLSDAAKQLGVKYSRLKHLIFKKRLPCYRPQENSRPRLLPQHLDIARNLISSGDLY